MSAWLLWPLALYGALLLADMLLLRRYRRLPTAPELHWVNAADGCRIALHRHVGGGEPVLLVHGLGANHANFDFDSPHGVAQALRARGFDCWCIDLRGCGLSDVPPTPWRFEDYLDYDLPAAVDHIRAIHGGARVHWVGHSMGGMLFYAFAGAAGRGDSIASATTLGSPVRFFKPRWFERLALRRRALLERLGVLWLLPWVLRWVAVLAPVLPRKALAVQYNLENADLATLRPAAATATAAVSVPLLLQFADWIVHHRWCDPSRTRDYRAGLARIHVPTQVLAGTADYLCPGYFAKYAYDQIATDDKAFAELGIAAGTVRDYGHIDLVFGRRAADEVYPRIGDWIAAHPIDKTA